MAGAFYAEDLRCSVCLHIFTEPVTLSCGHSFCRSCITAVPSAQCPQCRALLPAAGELEHLVTNHILKSLAEKAKERPLQRSGPGQEKLLCPEHDEKLKLFCVTDQQLACIICRDGEAHDGHKFKPIREAAASLRRDLDLGLSNMASQIEEIQNLRDAQSQARSTAKDLCGNLQSQIHRQFETLHQHLRKREEQIRVELKTKEETTVQKMNHSLSSMDTALAQCREQRESWQQLLQVTDPEMFLRRWSEEQSNTASKDLFKRWSEGLSVVQSPLFQGPFQSHLQFFMWKELLQVVEPRPDLLKLRDDNSSLTVSEDKRSFHYAPESWRQPPLSGMNYGHRFGNNLPENKKNLPVVLNRQRSHSPQVGMLGGGLFGQAVVNVPQTFPLFSTNEFSNGQHYWEVEVGQRSFWCVGVTNHFLKFENQKYFSCKRDESVEVSLRGVLRRVGVYLDCSSPGLSFYDAESMKQIVSVDCTGLVFPVSAYFNIQQREPDKNPIIICRY